MYLHQFPPNTPPFFFYNSTIHGPLFLLFFSRFSAKSSILGGENANHRGNAKQKMLKLLGFCTISHPLSSFGSVTKSNHPLPLSLIQVIALKFNVLLGIPPSLIYMEPLHGIRTEHELKVTLNIYSEYV